MNILIVSATEAEIALFIKKREANKISPNLFQISYQNQIIDILISGIGMVSTSYHLTKHLALTNKKYDLAINTGIAGCFDRNIDLGEVVHVVIDSFPELGAEDGDQFIPFETRIPLHIHRGGELKDTFEIVQIGNLKNVRGITVNTVHGNEKSIERIKRQSNADVESMEGAAFFYCCLQENIACVQIRAISNYVERRNKEAWKTDLAIQNLNEAIIRLMEGIERYF